MLSGSSSLQQGHAFLLGSVLSLLPFKRVGSRAAVATQGSPWPLLHVLAVSSADRRADDCTPEAPSCPALPGAWGQSWCALPGVLVLPVLGAHCSRACSRVLLPSCWSMWVGTWCLKVWGTLPFSLVFPCSSVGKESACSAGDPASIPGSGRSPGEGNGSPLQASCLENPMDRGVWWATIHGVARVGQSLALKGKRDPSSGCAPPLLAGSGALAGVGTSCASVPGLTSNQADGAWLRPDTHSSLGICSSSQAAPGEARARIPLGDFLPRFSPLT